MLGLSPSFGTPSFGLTDWNAVRSISFCATAVGPGLRNPCVMGIDGSWVIG
jgi:hypothetical protein